MEDPIVRGTGFSEYEARIKLLVLSYSLAFENLASDSLRLILNLDESSISLGNTNQALSMNQKVLLMLDSKYFEKTDKENIIKFMSIRNQFMHNADAKSFESCLRFLNGTDTFLEKQYLQKKESGEQKAGGERAAKEIADEEINNKHLLPYDLNDKEKLLFKSWISFSEDVILVFQKVANKLTLINSTKNRISR